MATKVHQKWQNNNVGITKKFADCTLFLSRYFTETTQIWPITWVKVPEELIAGVQFHLEMVGGILVYGYVKGDGAGGYICYL